MRRPWRFGILALVFISLVIVVIYLRAELTTTEPDFEPMEGFAVRNNNNNSIPPVADPAPADSANTQTQEITAAPHVTTQETDDSPTEEIEISKPEAISPFEFSGTLGMRVDGKLFGEETYHLRRYESGQYELISTGYFSFKVVVVNTKFHFQQAIAWDKMLFPDKISFKLKGPLGVGNRNLNVAFMSDQPYRSAVITSGSDESQVRLPDGPVAIQGTFSSFSIFPMLLHSENQLDLEIFISNGMGRSDGTAASSVDIRILKTGIVSIRDDQTALEATEYMLIRNEGGADSQSGSLRLLYRENDFIGVYAETTDERANSFQVFRSDIFPNGFEVVRSNGEN